MKRALIVDDSRSARVILSRMLEGYGLGVDTSESAEQALEFLQHNRPDVIFMDHLMPGMDGFQAVQAIKSNPQTATIPVLMYTSQEGEMYVSQARALGAVGVLPKTVKHSDVSRVLYQLRLLPDRREGRAAVVQSIAQSVAQAVNDATVQVQLDQPPPPGELETAIRAAVAPLLKEQSAEMRRFVLATLETFVRRIGAEAKAEAAPTVVTEEEAAAAAAPPTLPPPPTRWPLFAALALIALLPTVVLAVLYTRALQTSESLVLQSAQLTTMLEEQQTQLSALRRTLETQRTAPAATPELVAAGEPVKKTRFTPYGEAPLSGARLEELRGLVEELRGANFRGRIKVTTYVGDFCLTGNGVEGYSLAPDDLAMRRCDLVGNPFEDALTAAQRQSLAFANLVSSVRQQSSGALDIVVEHAGRRPAVAYPLSEQLAKTSAGEWNRIAAQNNRVEFIAEPHAG